MMFSSSKTRMIAILSATGLVLVLATSLAVRVSARSGDPIARPYALRPPTPAVVPPPPPIVLAEVPTPFCWGCGWNENAPLEFQLDLDLLAPVGDGRSNAALWFERFSRDSAESVAGTFNTYRERRVKVTIDGKEWTGSQRRSPIQVRAMHRPPDRLCSPGSA